MIIKKILLLSLLTGGSVMLACGWQKEETKDLHGERGSSISSPTVTAAVTPEVKGRDSDFDEVAVLEIPKLGVTAGVEHVGEDSEGRMDVPEDDDDVAWWKYGAKPGQTGSAVLAGHFDTRSGGAAVFYRLGKLKPGDEVTVADEDGDRLEFEVSEVKSYPDADFPIDLVFAQNDDQRLNLITCSGTFDRTVRNYTDRLVVFTRLKDE